MQPAGYFFIIQLSNSRQMRPETKLIIAVCMAVTDKDLISHKFSPHNDAERHPFLIPFSGPMADSALLSACADIITCFSIF